MTARSGLRDLVAPPALSDPDDSRRAAVLHWVLMAWALTMVAVMAAAPFTGRDLRLVWPIQSLILAAAVICLWLLHVGRLRAVSIGFPTTIWALATTAAALLGGLRAPAIWAYPVVVLLAGFFWSRNAALGFAALSVLAGIALGLLQQQGLLPDLGLTPESFLLGMAGSVAITAVLIHLELKEEEEGRRAARHLRMAMESGRVGTWEWEIETGQVTWSSNVKGMFLLPEGSFAETYAAYQALIHPDDRAYVEGAIRQSLEGGTPYEVEHRILVADGRTRWIRGRGEATRNRRGEPVRMSGTVMDISDRKVAELGLERSERLLAEAQRVARLGSWEWEIETGHATWTEELHRIFGVEPEQFTQTYDGFLERVHPEDREYADSAIREGLEHNRPIDYHCRVVRPDGSIRTVRMQAQVLKNVRGEAARVVGTGHDVTETKEIEDALRHQVRRNEKILDTLLDGYLLADPSGRILDVNPACCDLTQYSRQELCDRTISDLDSASPAEILARMQDLQAEGSGRFEARLRRRDGAVLDVELSVTVMQEDRGPVIAAFVHDTTSRKRAERSLKVIGECRQALVRATDEPQLLHDVCEALVTSGGYRLAWVGVAERHGERRVVPVAQSGFEKGSLDSLNISLSDPERGHGPTASAIHTRRATVCRSILTDPSLAPWRADAIARGYQASIALPLVHDDEAIGALNIYASESDAFDDAEVTLLAELSEDVAHGLGALQTRRLRRLAEEALRESEAGFRTLVAHSPISIWTCDAEGTCDFANPAALDLLGIADPGEVVGRYNAYRDTSEPGGPFVRHLERAYHGEVVRFHHTLDMGTVKYRASRRGTLLLDATVFPLPAEGNERPRVVVVQQDVTERERAERALRESEERYRTLFENAPLGIGVADTDGNLLQFNDAMLQQGGYSRSDIEALRNVAHLYHDVTDRERILGTLRREGRVLGEEIQFKAKDGSSYHVSLSLVPVTLEGRPHVLAMSQDVRERRKAEAALRESEARLRSVIENTPIVLFAVDREGIFTLSEGKGLASLGLEPGQVVGQSVFDFYADVESIVENLRAGLAGEERSWTVEVAGIHWNTRVMPVTDPDGKPAGLIGVAMDITELVRAQEMVRRANEQQAIVLSNIDELVYSLRFEAKHPGRGVIDFISAQAEPIIGYGPGEFEARPELWFEILHPDDRQAVATQTRHLAKTRQPSTRLYRLLDRTSRQYRWMEDRATPRVDDAGQVIGIFGVARDVTERREAEETLRQYSEQLRSLTARVEAVREEERTTISREIHDELGQALTGLKMDLSWLMGRLGKRAKAIRERGEAMARLVDSTIVAVRDLSTRLRPAVLDDLGLAAAVEWQAQDMGRRTGTEVDVYVDEQVRLDRGRATAMFRILQETLTNVVRHAQATRVTIRLALTDGQVELTVTDNGIGISDEALDSSRSLGLLGIRERASVIGGSVTFQRNRDHGTTVAVRVPVTANEGLWS